MSSIVAKPAPMSPPSDPLMTEEEFLERYGHLSGVELVRGASALFISFTRLPAGEMPDDLPVPPDLVQEIGREPPHFSTNSLIRALRISTGSLLRLRCWKPMCPLPGRSLIAGASVSSCRFTFWSNFDRSTS